MYISWFWIIVIVSVAYWAGKRVGKQDMLDDIEDAKEDAKNRFLPN